MRNFVHKMALLAMGDRASRSAEGGRTAGADLDKTERGALPGDQVNFSDRKTDIGRFDAKALAC